MAVQLTTPEQQRLKQCEMIIGRGLETFIDIGNALLKIRDGRLYREDYATFEEYCRGRWRMTRQHANRMIAAAEVVGYLEPIGSILPITESQARALTPLSPDQQREVWARAVEFAPDGKITGAHVKRMIDEITATHDVTFESASDDLRRVQIRSNNEWYTPPMYLEAARAVMGEIDVDPASSEAANENVKAQIFYSMTDDGLTKEWPGRCFMNPPYGTKGPLFVAELLRQYEAEIVQEAILLTNSNATETNWFAPLWDYLLCFVRGRINFIGNVGQSSSSTHGSVFIYLGDNDDAFQSEFARFGPIVRRVG